MRILVINPGATSTKVAVFSDGRVAIQANISHDKAELNSFPEIIDQLDFRLSVVRDWLAQQGFSTDSFDAVAGRGGMVRHIEGGTYVIGDEAVNDASKAPFGQHPANLGIIMAAKLAKEAGVHAFFSDPVSTDEWPDFVHLSGFEPIERRCFFHALNQKATAKEAAKQLNKAYEDLRLVVVHMGGGVSVAAHLNGRIVDVFNVMDEGAMAGDRSGSLPVQGLIDYCFSGLDKKTVKRKLAREGGFISYLGTQDFLEIEQRIKSGDDKARLVFEAYVWQLVKDIGSMAGILGFKVDAVVFTGGMANASYLTDRLKPYISALAPVFILAGEREMQALAEGAAEALLAGKAKIYPSGVMTDL